MSTVGFEHPLVTEARPSPITALGVLTVQSFQRHWRVRTMGWVSIGLLTIVLGTVLVVTLRDGWSIANRRARGTSITYRRYAENLLLPQRLGLDTPFVPVRFGFQSALLALPHSILTSEEFLRRWSYLSFTRWTVLVVYVGFVLPLFTLSYASGAFGAEREARSLVWVMTRPIPRSLIYLAKYCGTLPWCLAFGMGGFAALCLAGGELGRRAFALYWPAAAIGTVAFAALFHLLGALFRRPVVVGLVYVFFFEALVSLLPGSLKLLSLSYYIRCLVYNAASAAGYPTALLDGSQPVSDTSAWVVLTATTIGLTVLGMALFSRCEYRDHE